MLDHGAGDAVWAQANGAVTMAQLRAEVDWLAGMLGHHGIRARSTVSLVGIQSFTQLWTILALWSIGAQVMLIEPRTGARDIQRLRELCRPQFHIRFNGLDRLGDTFIDECEVVVSPIPGGRPADTGHCLVQFSSGTTGQMKAISRTAESLCAELDRLRSLPDMPRAGERVLLLESFARSFSLIGGVLHALDVGATVVFAPQRRPNRMLEAARDVHAIIGTPRHFELINSVDTPPALPALRLVISSGEPLPHSAFELFYDRFGVRIGQAYGTTETGLIAANFDGGHGPSTLGRPLPEVRTRVRQGELHVHVAQSPYLFGDDEPRKGGWLSTQDLVSVEPASGVLRLRGCLDSEMPAADPGIDLLEIENVLYAHRDVSEAVVLCVEAIEAHVAGPSRLRQSELLSWCQRRLGAAKTPSRCHVLPDLPRTASGKLLRSQDRLLASYHRLSRE
jgi:acyl-coenzyme A synthetase/AMP-(fatty) acid ligase